MQKKDYLTNLMHFIYERSLSTIKCAYIAKIVKLTLPTASIQPLAMPNGNKQPMVEDAYFATLPVKMYGNLGRPISYKLDYHTGDNVLVAVLDQDDEYFKNKGKFNVTSKRKHAIDFSVIIGKIASKNDFE